MIRPFAFKLLCILLMGAVGAPPGRAAVRRGASTHPMRIRLIRGAISAHTPGRLSSGNGYQAFFVVRAQKEDRMIVNIVPVARGLATGGEVRAPSGRQDGQHGGVIYDHRLVETGDYIIRVARNLMADGSGRGAFVLEVVILPPYLAIGPAGSD